MGSKLYVGNLSYDVTGSDLQSLFEAHGTVESAEVIADRDTGRSKGFGFVQMASDAEAQAAIAALNGQDHAGRALTVNVAKPREDRPRSGGGGGGGAEAATAAVVVVAVDAVDTAAAAAAAEAAAVAAATKPFNWSCTGASPAHLNAIELGGGRFCRLSSFPPQPIILMKNITDFAGNSLRLS